MPAKKLVTFFCYSGLAILETLETLSNDESAIALAQSLGQLSPMVMLDIWEKGNWRDRLHPDLLQYLTQPREQAATCSLEVSPQEIIDNLEALLNEQNPLIQAVCLYVIAQLDPERALTTARDFCSDTHPPLLRETAELLLSQSDSYPPLTKFPTLEKLVYLFDSDFFHRMHNETLMALADRAQIKTYSSGAHITEEGDTCRELLLLVEGDAQIHFHLDNNKTRVENLHPGQTLDELEVLAHSEAKNTIIAASETTRILAIPVDSFDALLDRDRDFARRVLELESRQLQRFIRSVHPS
jgi:CRP-like cAMP-binding protein